MAKSFIVEVQTDSSGKWYGNAMRYTTREAAEAAAFNLACRWTAVREYRSNESDDAPNDNPESN